MEIKHLVCEEGKDVILLNKETSVNFIVIKGPLFVEGATTKLIGPESKLVMVELGKFGTGKATEADLVYMGMRIFNEAMALLKGTRKPSSDDYFDEVDVACLYCIMTQPKVVDSGGYAVRIGIAFKLR